jgi:hypothetical protein
MERILTAENPAIIQVYEGQIVKLEEQKIALVEKFRCAGVRWTRSTKPFGPQ